MSRPDFIQAPTITPSELVRAIRANIEGDFNLNHGEAEMLVRLFASVVSVTAECELLLKWKKIDPQIGASA